MNIITLFIIGGILLVLWLFWTTVRLKPERSVALLGLGIGLTFTVGLYFTLLLPSFNKNWSSNTSDDQKHYHVAYADPPAPAASQLRGHRIYQREGCMYCHTQQVRPLVNEMKRYSVGSSVPVPADEREYVYDQPHFLGTRRIGPDISRVGGKYNDDWHYSHFFFPRQLVPDSIMPAFTWLFTKDLDGNPVPNQDCRDLVAYVQTLGYERQVFDPKLNGGKGGWRSWLKPEDMAINQAISRNAVNHINPTETYHGVVHSGDATSPTNLAVPKGQ